MKRIFYLLPIMALASCSKFLDVKPTGIQIPTAIKDYDLMLNNFQIGQAASMNNIVYMNPDIVQPGSQYENLKTWGQIRAFQWAENLYDINQSDPDYNTAFGKIHVYNQVLDNIDDAEMSIGYTDADRGRLKGEALAQRALEYFLLVNEYAPNYSATTLGEKAVPMPLTVNLKAQQPRSTVGEIYAQIEKDLAQAEQLMQGAEPFIEAANFRPGMASIKGLWSYIHLYKGEFEKASLYADEALKLYDFMYDYNSIQRAVPSNPWHANGYTTLEAFFPSTNVKSVLWNRIQRGQYFLHLSIYSPELESKFDKDHDRRWQLFATQIDYYGNNLAPYYCFGSLRYMTNVGIMVPELVLHSAEAKCRIGDYTGSVAALNKMRAKRYTPDVAVYTFTTPEALLEEIKTERRREYFVHGRYFFDLKRYHAYGDKIPTFTRAGDGQVFTLAPGSKEYVVPFPQNISNFNPNL